MFTNRFYILFWCFGLLTSSISHAQRTFEFGGLPAVNLNKKLPKNWAINFKTESRQLFQSGTFGEGNKSGYEYALTDFSFITTKRFGLNSRASAGYLLRFRDGQTVQRAIQQFAITQRLNSFRLAHRLVSDQTFTPDEPTEYRFRYRITSEIPLNGQSADQKEFYIKVNNEYLNGFEGGDYDLEIRLVPLLGYIINDNHKIETGLDYRLSSFIKDVGRQRYWLSINWYIEL